MYPIILDFKSPKSANLYSRSIEVSWRLTLISWLTARRRTNNFGWQRWIRPSRGQITWFVDCAKLFTRVTQLDRILGWIGSERVWQSTRREASGGVAAAAKTRRAHNARWSSPYQIPAYLPAEESNPFRLYGSVPLLYLGGKERQKRMSAFATIASVIY